MYHKWNRADEDKVRQLINEGHDDRYIANIMWTTARRVALFRRRKRIGHELDQSTAAVNNRKYCKKYYWSHKKDERR